MIYAVIFYEKASTRGDVTAQENMAQGPTRSS